MKPWSRMACVAAIILASAATAGAGVSFQIGTDDFFLSVGDYDYLPYAYQDSPGYAPPQINFRSMMRQYGTWINVPPFGAVWRPYASHGWRPYAYGHWIYTEYGPYWEGYEPWAWAGYHYGSWVFVRRFGWVWVPGYDWHPGRVAWARGYGTIGWMPLPPDGYDYNRGSVRYGGRNNHFNYSDRDFDQDFDSWYDGGYDDGYGQGGRRPSPFESQSYASINLQLWVFIDGGHFGEDNYADFELGPDYTREAFRQQEVRISTRPLDKQVLEGIVQQRIPGVPVVERQIRADQRTIRMVVPSGNAPVERIRQQSPQVVREMIAPAFADAQRQFKGRNSKIQGPVSKIFQQEQVRPNVQSRSREQLVKEARVAQEAREKKRLENLEAARERIENERNRRPNVAPGRRPVTPSPDRAEPGTTTPPPRPVAAPAPPPPTPEPRQVVRPRRETPVPTTQPEPVVLTPIQQVPPSPNRVERVPVTEVPTTQPEPPRGQATQRPDRARPIRPNGSPGAPGTPPAEQPGAPDGGDAAITSQANAAVKATAPMSAPAIRIRTSNGVITVSGQASTPADAERILQALSAVPGVQGVRNELSIPRKRSR